MVEFKDCYFESRGGLVVGTTPSVTPYAFFVYTQCVFDQVSQASVLYSWSHIGQHGAMQILSAQTCICIRITTVMDFVHEARARENY